MPMQPHRFDLRENISLCATPSFDLSSVRPPASKQYTMFPRQVVIVTVLQRILKVDLNVQYKGKRWREGQTTTLSWTSSYVHAMYSSPDPLYLYRNCSSNFLSLLLSIPVSSPPFSVSPFHLLFYGRTDWRYVLKWEVSFYLPPIETWRQ